MGCAVSSPAGLRAEPGCPLASSAFIIVIIIIIINFISGIKDHIKYREKDRHFKLKATHFRHVKCDNAESCWLLSIKTGICLHWSFIVKYTRNSAIADKPRNAFRGQTRSQNTVVVVVVTVDL